MLIGEDGQTISVRIVQTSALLEPTPNTPATGSPTISVTTQVGETLTVDISGIADEDGLNNVSYRYQWIANDGTVDTDIQDATASTYTPSVSDVGKSIKVKVSFSDDANNDETLTSVATAAVAATVPTAPLGLTVSRRSQIQELDASWQSPSSTGGSDVTGYKVQWKETADSWDTATDVAEATVTGTTHAITGLTGGVEYTVRVIATNDVGDGPASTEAAGTPAGSVSEQNTETENNAPTGLPTISGTPQVGETLTADTSAITDEDGLDDVSYNYQWIAGDTNIDGATGSSYLLTSSELGQTIKVRVSYTDDAENSESLTSAATAAVTRPPPSRAPEMDGISIHDGMLRILGGDLELVDVNADRGVAPADVGSYISSFKVQWKSGSQRYDATRQAVLAPKPMTVTNVTYYFAHMPSYDITGLTNGVEYTVRVIATNAGGDGPPSQEQTATPGAKSEELRQYIEDEIVEEHESSHPWLRQTWDYLQNNNIPLIVWTLPASAPNTNTFETYRDYSSGIQAKYVDSLNFSVSTVDGAEATKRETILINLAAIYTMTNGVSSSPGPLGIAYVYFRTADTLSLSGCWDSRLYLDVVVSLVLHDSLTGASDWNRCMARSEDATALAVVRSALSGQTPAWFADTYHDSDGDPELERLWSDVQIVGHTDVVGYQLRNSFGGYCDTDPNWGLRISRSLSPVYVFAGLDTLVNPWRDGGCVPSAPITLTASLTGDGTASVSWKAPESNGGSLLSGYEIQWQPVAAEEGTTPQTKYVDFDDWSDEARPTEVSETIDGLNDGVEYKVRVLAYNPNGDGTAAEVTVSKPNAAPTGLPEISGTPQVGETLTVDTSPIADGDGLDSVSYSYQWIQSDNGADTDIAGETDSTYTLVLADLGKTIKVQVTFTDDADNDEMLTSEATVAVAATVPSAPQSMTVTSGSQTQELDASWQAPSSNGGSAVTGYKVQWKESTDSWDTADDVSEATETGTTHTITSLTGGVEYAVRVIATNVAGDGPASTEARATPADSPASGEEGTETGESDSSAVWTATLTVGMSGSGSEAVWGYSWFLDVMGTLDERTYSEGDQTIEVMAILLSNGFVAFNVRPHPSVDFVLTVDGTEFASADASEVKSRTLISYVWATTLDWAEDDRVALSLTLKATDSAEQSEPAENTPATGLPTISGTPQVGQNVTADTSAISDADGLDNVDYSYQWLADYTEIADASDSTYTLVAADVGKTVQVKVTFTDNADNAETLTSAATEPVSAADEEDIQDGVTVWSGILTVGSYTPSAQFFGQPTKIWLGYNHWSYGSFSHIPSFVSGGVAYRVYNLRTTNAGEEVKLVIIPTPQQDFVLRLDDLEFSSGEAHGIDYVVFRYYEWADPGLNWTKGQQVAVSVAVIDDSSTPLTDDGQVTNAAPMGLPTISGTPQVGEILTADVSSITDADGLTNVSYRYQWVAGGTAIDGATGSSYTLTSSEQGKTIQVRVTFTDDADNEESLTSEATEEVTASPVPLTVSLTSVPSTHDGTNVFTFNISFSEHFGLSYITLKSHAFTVTEGSVEKAQRTDKPSNIPWKITVQPYGNRDVTIVLPATTDCGAQGAICTGDDRKLSNRLELTVRGP